MEQDNFFEIDDQVRDRTPKAFTGANNKKKRALKAFLIVMLSLLIIFIAIFYYYLSAIKTKYNKILYGPQASTLEESVNLITPGKLDGENNGDINILFIGGRNSDMKNPAYSSAMLLMNLDTEKNEINLISVPRDLWAPINNSYGKANSVFGVAVADPNQYTSGGLPFTKETFSKFLGVDINYIFTCDFDSFENIVNKIGKVNVEMSQTEANRYPFLTSEEFASARDKQLQGVYHLNGEQSFTFVSWPKNALPDFDRLRRMQLYLSSFVRQYVNGNFLKDYQRIIRVLDAANGGVRTDMQIWEAKKIVEIGVKVSAANISQHRLTTNLNDEGGLLKITSFDNTTYSPVAGDNNFSEIQGWVQKIISK